MGQHESGAVSLDVLRGESLGGHETEAQDG